MLLTLTMMHYFFEYSSTKGFLKTTKKGNYLFIHAGGHQSD